MNGPKRASWVLSAIALTLTVGAMIAGVEVLSPMAGIIASIWTGTFAMFGYAYRSVMKPEANAGASDPRVVPPPPPPAQRKKASYVGVPAIFKLELACKHLNAAYGDFGCFLVGSALERPDWRDVDVVFIMGDEAFLREFPDTDLRHFEFDRKWCLHTIALSGWLSEHTGLPIDFKIQPQTWANERHSSRDGKRRHAIGIDFVGLREKR